MPDASHAGRMDAIYRTQRHFYDITRKLYLLGRDRLITELAPPPGGTVLEVGCGTGRNLIVAARRWPQARFYGLDISEAMLETARANVAKAQLTDRIAFAAADAASFDPHSLFGVSFFDRIFQSYTLSMIPDWPGAIRQALRCLEPTGELHIVDFGQQERLPRPWKAFLFNWLAQFHVEPRAAMQACLDTLVASDHAGAMVKFDSLYRGYAWAARIQRSPSGPGR